MRYYYYVLLFLFSSLFIGCEQKEYVPVESVQPSIRLDSIRVVAMDSCVVSLSIHNESGFKMKKAEVILEDITFDTIPSVTYPLDIGEGGTQTISYGLNVNTYNHDYKIKAILESEKYTYQSEERVMRFSKFFIEDITTCTDCEDTYRDFSKGIMECVNRDTLINIYVHFRWKKITPYSVEVTLNGNIPVKSTLDFNSQPAYTETSKTSGVIYIPRDIPPGDYHVHIKVDGMEYVSMYKIRVLEGSSEEHVIDFYDGLESGSPWFVHEDELYYVGGLSQSVYSCNMKTKKWTRKKDLPFRNLFVPQNLQWGKFGYVLAWEKDIWKYDLTTDSWENLGKYPGQGNRYLTAFVNNATLYVGGGTKLYNGRTYDVIDPVFDFWAYDILQGKWTQLKDLPYESYHYVACCTSEDKGFALTCYRELWQYDFKTGNWEQKGRQTGGGPYTRMHSSIVYKDNHVYLLGGAYYGLYGLLPLSDVWDCNLASGEWKLNCFTKISFYGTPVFTYNDEIYTGGILKTSYSDGYVRSLIMLEINPYFHEK